MAERVQWSGDKFLRDFERRMERNVLAATVFLEAEVKDAIKIQGPKKTKGVSGKFQRASRPGEPPRLRTGNLRNSIANEVTGLTGRVGTNLKYGKSLELGTRHMAPRPYLRATLRKFSRKIASILSRPLKSGLN